MSGEANLSNRDGSGILFRGVWFGQRAKLCYNYHAMRLRNKAEEEAELESLKLANTLVDVIADKMGSDILLLDLGGVSLIADYFIICSAQSERQIEAITEDIRNVLKKTGVHILSVEGTAASGWVLMDYGGIIIHIFSPYQRERYRLEALWDRARTVLRLD